MTNLNPIPQEKGIDHSIGLLKDGYLYILNRRMNFHSDVFETRIFGKKIICMGGTEAAEIFYDPEKFKRQDAAPERLVQTLFGKNGVQSLDGEEHKHRKKMFMEIMSSEALKKLSDITEKHWEIAIAKWQQEKKIVFYEEVQKIMCRIACEWAGMPIIEDKVNKLTTQLVATFESTTAIGPAYWLGRNARNQVEEWLEELITKVRDGKLVPPENTALQQFSQYRDLQGNLLDKETVAVELLNILSPIVAISIFINFTVLALQQYPEEKKKIQSGDSHYAKIFTQEIRRFYPFIPFVAALVKRDFVWNGFQFEEGMLTLLDLFGTNHDPNIWDNPDVFNPMRFDNWKGSPFSFIPQGGGQYETGHRCAGEWVTIEIMKVSLDVLVNRLNYDLPEQDLSYSMTNMPSIPESKIILKNIQRKNLLN